MSITFKEFIKEAVSPDEMKAKMDAKYDGKPFKITLPVVIGGNGELRKKVEKREFTIDNTLQARRALSGAELIDLNKIKANPNDNREKPAYAINDPQSTKSNSLPYRLYGLPPRSRRKPGYSPEDLRKEVYARDN